MAKSIGKSNANAASATIKLSESQLRMLGAAALRDDRCLTRPTSIRGAQIAKLSETLIGAGYAREVKAKASAPVWRQEGKTGASFSLQLTAAGIKAAAMDGAQKGAVRETHLQQAEAEGRSNGNDLRPKADTVDLAKPTAALNIGTGKRQAGKPPSPTARVHGEPRPTSKIAAVIGLLSRAEGATLAELVAATDWLPHTTRAALTGLRKRGYSVTLDRTDRQRGSTYRIEARPDRGGLAPKEIGAEAA